MKILSVLLLNMVLSIPSYARAIEEKDIYFNSKVEDLMKGDIHYSIQVMSPRKMGQVFPEVIDLDTQGLLEFEGSVAILAKAMYVINRPVGFFDHEHIKDQEFIKHMHGKKRVESISSDVIKIYDRDYSYYLRSSFDSDDISTLPTSKAIKAVSTVKKIDVITKSASSIVVKEFNKFTKHAQAGLSISSYVPLKENRTLVVYYYLMAVNKGEGSDSDLKDQTLSEIKNNQRLINSYKEK